MSVFKSGYSSIYDGVYATKDYSHETELITDTFTTHAGPDGIKTVLDVGCGSGRHSIALARQDYQVTGIDMSQDMLGHAAKNAEDLANGQEPTWVQGDARTYDLDQTFDAGIVMFAVVGYMTTNQDVLDCLKTLRKHLKLGAPMVMDFWYGPAVLAQRPSDRVKEIELDNALVLRAVSTDLDSFSHTAQVNFNIWIDRDGPPIEQVQESHVMRYFFPQEIKLFLELAGFDLKTLSAFPSFSDPLTDETWNALVTAVAV